MRVFCIMYTNMLVSKEPCAPQALLLSGRGAGLFTCLYTVPIYIHKGRNFLYVVVYLTCPEIGKSMTSGQPQCDIIIDPTYHRFPYFRTGQIHNNREKVTTFVYIIVNIPAPRPLNNQVGAKMGKSTRPVYWGHTVITGCTVVGDMLEWALWVTPTGPR